jgi:hypothetical protein
MSQRCPGSSASALRNASGISSRPSANRLSFGHLFFPDLPIDYPGSLSVWRSCLKGTLTACWPRHCWTPPATAR